MYNNGFHINHAAVGTCRISLDETSSNKNYDAFFKATQCLMEEQGLNPTEFTMLTGIYQQFRQKPIFPGVLRQRDF
jgi:hypothetical protein